MPERRAQTVLLSGAGAPLGLAAARAWSRSASRSRRFSMAFGSGVLAAFALPPFHLVPLLILSFGLLLWLVDGKPKLIDAAGTGWSFGLGFFATGLYWIGISFFVDAERLAWLAVPAVLGLSAFLALFTAGTAVAASLPECRGGGGRVFALATAWTTFEWLRGNILTGFPWNLIGYAWTFSDPFIQPASAIGVYGMSFVTVVLAALPALNAYRRPASSPWLFPGLAIAATCAIWAVGSLRLATIDPAAGTGVRLRVVQGGVEQSLKWRPEERESILERYLGLSQRGGLEGIDLVVWPETAFPLLVTDESTLPASVSRAVPKGGYLVTGAMRRTQTGTTSQYWNSVVAIDENSQIAGVYDKRHLVPFGEYVPLRWILPFEKLTAGTIDLSSGSGSRLLDVPGLPAFAPLICYEAIFPGSVVDRGVRPSWLLNVSNDAWFGQSTGPYQHFSMARLRAVEEGLPLVRAGNTGISAIVDAYGRVNARMGLGQTGAIDGNLPPPLVGRTFFARAGDGIVFVLLILGALAVLLLKNPGGPSPSACKRHRFAGEGR